MSTNLEGARAGGNVTAVPLGTLPDEALVNAHQVKSLAGEPSDPTLWRWINKGDFPKPERRTGPNQNGSRLWRLGTIRQWLRGDWPQAKAA